MLVKRKRRKGPGQEGLITASPFLMPSLIGLLVFSLLPLLISAFISLTDWNGLDQLTAPGFFQEHFIGLDNYKAILSSPEFWGVLWNTFRYIIMYIPLMLVASLGVAYLLSRQRPGVTAFRIIYYIPVLTSWVAASMIWKSMLSPEYGAVNNILAVFGIQGPGWLLDEAWAMPAIVLVSVWKDMGFFGLILLSGMVGINKSYYEAASLDGAGSWQKFWKITLPLMTPAIFYDHDRRRPQWRHTGHGGAHLQVWLPLLPHGLCGGLLLDPVRHHYGVHRHPDEGPREVGQL